MEVILLPIKTKAGVEVLEQSIENLAPDLIENSCVCFLVSKGLEQDGEQILKRFLEIDGLVKVEASVKNDNLESIQQAIDHLGRWVFVGADNVLIPRGLIKDLRNTLENHPNAGVIGIEGWSVENVYSDPTKTKNTKILEDGTEQVDVVSGMIMAKRDTLKQYYKGGSIEEFSLYLRQVGFQNYITQKGGKGGKDYIS